MPTRVSVPHQRGYKGNTLGDKLARSARQSLRDLQRLGRLDLAKHSGLGEAQFAQQLKKEWSLSIKGVIKWPEVACF